MKSVESCRFGSFEISDAPRRHRVTNAHPFTLRARGARRRRHQHIQEVMIGCLVNGERRRRSWRRKRCDHDIWAPAGGGRRPDGVTPAVSTERSERLRDPKRFGSPHRFVTASVLTSALLARQGHELTYAHQHTHIERDDRPP